MLDEISDRSIAGTPVAAGIAHGRPCSGVEIELPEMLLSTLPRVYYSQIQSHFDACNEEYFQLANQCSEFGSDVLEAIYGYKLLSSDQQLQKWISFNLLENNNDMEALLNQYLATYKKLLTSCLQKNLESQARLFEQLKKLLLQLLGDQHFRTSCHETIGCRVGECKLKNPHIYICKELSAISVLMLDDSTKAVIVESRSVSVDAAIMLRGLRLPVVSGLNSSLEEIRNARNLLVNGANGEVIVNPSQATLDKYSINESRPV